MSDSEEEEAGERLRDAATVAYGALALLMRFGQVVVAGLAVGVALVTDDDRRRAFKQWFLLEGDRWAIVGGITAVVFLATFVLARTDVFGVGQSGFVTNMFSAFISGLFSFVPIVITVNQLTVSQLMESPKGLREQIRGVRTLRSEMAELQAGDGPPPTEPALFLSDVVESVVTRTVELRTVVERVGDPELVDSIDELVATVDRETDEIRTRLNGSHLRLIVVLLPMMGDPYSESINRIRRIRAEHYDRLPGRATDLLDELEELLLSLDVLRQYFKAIYIQQELSNLSRLIGYSGVGAFFVAMYVIMVFANGEPLPNAPVLLDGLVSLAITLETIPFVILLSFVLRIATIAKRTAAPGAFTPRRESPKMATNRPEEP
ncbi:hypothetical protein [Haloprofundus salinisoli]|uniref:hypothetical protein n=1 Tax=Haloprofundus salinisoli TaxID=2876193 RepID=UPI001CCC498F|nr:hypothetical protein [Haloprofundus salinisoli]